LAKQENKITWQEMTPGCIVSEPGNASQYKTGDWRSQLPVHNFKKCIKCGLCYVFCPEACINETKEGFFEADLFYCKGCGICAHECPTGAIVMKDEEEK